MNWLTDLLTISKTEPFKAVYVVIIGYAVAYLTVLTLSHSIIAVRGANWHIDQIVKLTLLTVLCLFTLVPTLLYLFELVRMKWVGELWYLAVLCVVVAVVNIVLMCSIWAAHRRK